MDHLALVKYEGILIPVNVDYKCNHLVDCEWMKYQKVLFLGRVNLDQLMPK